MHKINDYKDLLVWQKAMNLVVEVCHTTRMMPKVETYGPAAQMRRAAVPIPYSLFPNIQNHEL